MLKKNADNSYEIDLMQLFKALWSKIWLILIVAVIVGALSYTYSKVRIAPSYSASTMLYVNTSGSIDVASYKISSSDLSTAQGLVSTYLVILQSRTCLNEVIEEAGLDYNYGTLSGMISAAAVDETEIFKVTVVSGDAEEAALIANTIAKVLPDKISDIVDGSSVRVVDYAIENNTRVSPSYVKYLTLGIIVGAVIAAAFVIILELLDDIIHTEEYITETYPDIPLLAAIPDLAAKNPGSYKYGKKEKIAKGYEISYNNVVAEQNFDAPKAEEKEAN